jgi:tRNA(adenine34) deaminase
MGENHEKWMKWALAEAKEAGQRQEVPVGAVLLSEEKKVLALSHNLCITSMDPTAHAEIIALRMAGQKVQNYRLLNTTLYVTVEPCVMCMGAIINARVKRIVFGTRDEKGGAAGSLYNLPEDTRLNHQPEIIEGILENECRELIQQFFQARRKLSIKNDPVYDD